MSQIELLPKYEQNLLPRDGDVQIFSSYLERLESERLFTHFESKLLWKQDQITLYGKTHNVPRLQAWYGDEGAVYSYSGVKLIRNEWEAELQKLRRRVELSTGSTFNSVLCNYYRNGADYASWHSDDEKELGDRPCIASISLGETRSFTLKHRVDASEKKVKLDLSCGSLLLMKGDTQHFWKHQLNKTAKGIGARINLTFRKITIRE